MLLRRRTSASALSPTRPFSGRSPIGSGRGTGDRISNPRIPRMPCIGGRPLPALPRPGGVLGARYPSAHSEAVGASEPGKPVRSAGVHPVCVLAGTRRILIGPRGGGRTRRDPQRSQAGRRAAGASERTRGTSRQAQAALECVGVQAHNALAFPTWLGAQPPQHSIRPEPARVNPRGRFTRSRTCASREQVEYKSQAGRST